ncbi:uncharacterized protein LOC131659139 [Vicia villosa]|uniref:uncharacterized protein LOC131659139 n=1 Tax=Vicia villosa TaxID=3911 RepID=UPI00273C25D8|nr:uncharacterized protein LOC131659139 [Vicia villosa]
MSPLLFVVIMEYLHRKLDCLSRNPNFNFHSKCEKLKLVDLSFADDLLLFSRGDSVSVHMMMDRFKEFSMSTGLQVNPSKCKLYCGGMDDSEKRSVEDIIGFSRGSLPFKYLGIPLSSRKISSTHCMALAEKIGEKMKHWSFQLLSYAGRVQMVNSVVFGYTRKVWEEVLGWMCIQHNIQVWNQEMQWLIKLCKSRNWRIHFVKIAIAETVYAVLMDRNSKVFSKEIREKNTVNNIIGKIINRIWVYPKYRDRLAHLLLA